MKIQYLAIYIAAGVAFLAVSLWAFLSNGKSARAIRYKYKLGGLMLTAWAMLSAASCEGPGPFVTCYEPMVTCYDVAVEEHDEVDVVVKGYGGNKLKSGDVLEVYVYYASYENYRCRISADPENGDVFVIQTEEFALSSDDGNLARTEITLAATEYKGMAKVFVCGLGKDNDGNETEEVVGVRDIEII